MQDVHVVPRDPRRFAEVLDPASFEQLMATAAQAGELLAGRTVWCVNSTARGGGVAEMLDPLLGYCKGAGIDARWVVVEGDDPFFAVTKRLHHALHGAQGDGGALGPVEREAYDAVTARESDALAARVRPGDIVVLHDPQTAGLAPAMREAGARVVWRLHVGVDAPNARSAEGQAFIDGDLDAVEHFVVSRAAYAWPSMVPASRVTVIPPSIDALSPKNQDLADPVAVLEAAGLLSMDGGGRDASFVRNDGTRGTVAARALMDEDEPVPFGARIITQVSRWDPLKDPVGVVEGFARIAAELGDDVHLVVAGPDVSAVTDDPEGAQVLDAVRAHREALAPDVRRRVHLASLAMDDVEENAATVNALQRHSVAVIQKSLAEGFGLTVAEAMWKARPVLASRVGGIQDQIDHGRTGVLLDAHDLDAYGAALAATLADPARADAIGTAARERVREAFLESRHLAQWALICAGLLQDKAPSDA